MVLVAVVDLDVVIAWFCRAERRAVVTAAAAGLSMVCATAVDAASARRFTGAFSGTGRACYGRLYVRTKTIAWLTPFSQCQKVPYDIIEQHEQGKHRSFAFQLKRRGQDCRYGVIYLSHGDSADPNIDWQVIGYDTFDDYRADRAKGFKGEALTSLSCYLVRD